MQCFNATSCVNANSDDHKGPAAQQMTKRGPIIIVDNRDVLETSEETSPAHTPATIGKFKILTLKQLRLCKQ
jgi:hypothetical protein